ncbi:MAG: hypothetical protein ABI866_04290 [Dokdonella sp.]
MSEPVGEPTESSAPSHEESLLDSLSGALQGSLQVAKAAFALLRSELRLARTSAMAIIWLSFAFIILGAGAWLSTIAAIAAGIYQLSGNFFIGVAVVALINLAGIGWVVLMMRRCWRDVSLPQTRALIAAANPDVAPREAMIAVREEAK